MIKNKISINHYTKFALGFSSLLFIAPYAYADISGLAFRDFNANGSFDTGLSFNEVGVAGVTVKAFNSQGVQTAITTTESDGSYTLSGVSSGTPYRVEFSWTETWLKPGVANGTSVQFTDGAATGINLAMNAPDEYSIPSVPRLITSTYRSGSGLGSTDAALQSFLRSNTGLNADYLDANNNQGQGPKPDSEAILGDIGSTWGIAWQANKKRVYAASFLKRHVGLAHDLGAVYLLDETNQPGNFVRYFDLQGVTPANAPTESIDLGTVCRDAVCATESGRTGIPGDYALPDTKGAPSVDMDAFYKVGKVGFGDIDMQPSTDTLWLVNAYQQALISVDVSTNNSNELPGEVKQYRIAELPGTPVCVEGNLRPWALNFSQGKGFLGMTCDAYLGSRNAANLRAFVLSFDPNNLTQGFSTLIDFPLDYARDSGRKFQPWLDEAETTTGYLSQTSVSGQVDIPQPLLSDIEFDDHGNMYLNIMDIFTHQTGNYNYKPYSGGSTETINGIANGDFLKACKTSTGFVLEGAPGCATNYQNNVGPHNAGEFFEDNAGDSRAESANGSMALLHGSGQIDSMLMDPHPTGQVGQQWWSTQGINSYSLTTGAITNWYALHQAGESSFFGKGAGFGDIELLTDAAPVEIGNRVWLDNNGNGIQDANETGIENISVTLTCPRGSSTVSTDSSGQYLFSTLKNASFMVAGETCTLSIDSTQTVLQGLQVTQQNADQFTSNSATTDLRDSDAANKITSAEISLVIGREGENNHSLDFGYAPPPDLKLTKTIDKTILKLSDIGTYTLTLENESDVTATNISITDHIPNSLNLISASPSQGTFVNGIWSLPSLAGRTTATLSLEVKVNP